MKRIGNLYQRIISIENLTLAWKKASKGKQKQYGVIAFNKNPEGNIARLHQVLLNREFRTSEYKIFSVYEPKERLVYGLPFYPDRIVHHAIMNILEPIFVSVFTSNSYSCIKKKGIHAASMDLREALRDVPGTQYCLKIDIVKFYPNIDHDILKMLLRRKFKDPDLLWLLDEIIDSADGVPIGNYLSQYFANFYLTYFDHWIKEKLGVKNYFRYADDIVIPAENKPYLHWLLSEIRKYLWDNLKLLVKGNYQVFKVSSRGIDFVGYPVFHTHVRLRKGIKKNCARKLSKRHNRNTIASYLGWLDWADTKHLKKKLLHGKRFQILRDKTGHGKIYGRQHQHQKTF